MNGNVALERQHFRTHLLWEYINWRVFSKPIAQPKPATWKIATFDGWLDHLFRRWGPRLRPALVPSRIRCTRWSNNGHQHTFDVTQIDRNLSHVILMQPWPEECSFFLCPSGFYPSPRWKFQHTKTVIIIYLYYYLFLFISFCDGAGPGAAWTMVGIIIPASMIFFNFLCFFIFFQVEGAGILISSVRLFMNYLDGALPMSKLAVNKFFLVFRPAHLHSTYKLTPLKQNITIIIKTFPIDSTWNIFISNWICLVKTLENSSKIEFRLGGKIWICYQFGHRGGKTLFFILFWITSKQKKAESEKITWHNRIG